jgi:class 3 adenylate cyclase/tetratricopeptide (TPR) repeat protein
MKKVLWITILLLSIGSVFAQDLHKVDSLNAQLQNHEARKKSLGSTAATAMIDTTKADILFELSKSYLRSNPEKGKEYAEQCLSLSEQIGFKKGICNALNCFGNIKKGEGNYESALSDFQKSLKISEDIKDKKGISSASCFIGTVYLYQGKYPEALEKQLFALKLSEDIGDKTGMSFIYNELGLIYLYQNNNPEALKNFFACIKLKEEMGEKYGTAAAIHNIGMTYSYMGKNLLSIEYYLKAKKINLESGNKQYLAANLSMLAIAYFDQKNYSESLKNQFIGLKIYQELGDKYGIGTAHVIIGEVHKKMGNYSEALNYETIGLTIAKEIGSLDMMKESYRNLFEIDSALNNYKGSFENHKLYMQTMDSLYNIEKNKKITQMQMKYDFDKKESLTKVENEKELQKQKFIRNGFVGGFGLVLLFSILIVMQRNKVKREKQNVEHEKLNVEIEKDRSDALLLNILPAEVAEELKTKGTADAKHFDNVTVLFTDFKSFTTISEALTPQELVGELHACFKAFDEICGKYNIEKIKTIGDAYLAVCGLPIADENHAENVVNAALEIREFMKQRRENLGAKTFEIRIGINSGSVVAGIVGVKKFAYDIWGDTVNTAARMEQNSEAGKINISETTHALVKEKFRCEYRGEIDAKNKGKLAMYFVETAHFE